MAIRVDRTPNPAAMKFTVGAPVGGPATFSDPDGVDDWLAEILAIEDVASVFTTADFVTVTAGAQVDWDAVCPRVVEVLEARFG